MTINPDEQAKRPPLYEAPHSSLVCEQIDHLSETSTIGNVRNVNDPWFPSSLSLYKFSGSLDRDVEMNDLRYGIEKMFQTYRTVLGFYERLENAYHGPAGNLDRYIDEVTPHELELMRNSVLNLQAYIRKWKDYKESLPHEDPPPKLPPIRRVSSPILLPPIQRVSSPILMAPAATTATTTNGFENVSTTRSTPLTDISLASEDNDKSQEKEDLTVLEGEEGRECLQCASQDTPEWRRGPFGPRSLCNACGLFWGKLSKKFGPKKALDIMIDRKERGEGLDRKVPIDDTSQ